MSKSKRKRPNHLIIKDMIEGGHYFVFCLKNFKRNPKVAPSLIHHYVDDFEIVYDFIMEHGEYTIYGKCNTYNSFDKNRVTLTPFDLETGRIIVGFDKETGAILLDGGMSKSSFKRYKE